MTVQERLIKYYQTAFKRLLKKISEMPEGASWKRYYKRLVAEIEKEVAKLDTAAAKQLVELVKKTYTAAEAKALADIQAGPFGGLNRSAMRLIAENAVDDLVEANHYFGRHLADTIRRIGLDAIAEKLSTGQTIREARRRIIERLQANGMSTVTGGSGRQYRLDSYAELVARTTTREATNTATTSTGEQLGYDLVKFSTHYPTCEVCAPIQGRVFSISGKDRRFPALSDVPGFDKGFKTIHPNCRHVVVLTVEVLWTDAEREKYLADAKKPLRGDTRTQQEVDAYNATQAEKRDRRQDRRQYEKYKAALSDDAPGSFSAFRAIKRANGDAWDDLKRFYRYKIDNPTAMRVHYNIYQELKAQGIRRGQVLPPEEIVPYILADGARPYHAMQRMQERSVTDDEVRRYVSEADVMFSQWKGARIMYVSSEGVTIVEKNAAGDWIVKTTWSRLDFDEEMEAIIKAVKKYV